MRWSKHAYAVGMQLVCNSRLASDIVLSAYGGGVAVMHQCMTLDDLDLILTLCKHWRPTERPEWA